MGYIDIVGGPRRRRIDAPELDEPIRIDVGGDHPSVSLPAAATVTRAVEEPPPAGAGDDGWIWGD